MSDSTTPTTPTNPTNAATGLALLTAALTIAAPTHGPQITVAGMTDGNQLRLQQAGEERLLLDYKSEAAKRDKQAAQERAKEKLTRLALKRFSRGGKGNNQHHNSHSNRQYTWSNRGR